MCVCVCVCMCICMRICMYISRAGLYLDVCVRTCTHVHTNTHTHTHTKVDMLHKDSKCLKADADFTLTLRFSTDPEEPTVQSSCSLQRIFDEFGEVCICMHVCM